MEDSSLLMIRFMWAEGEKLEPLIPVRMTSPGYLCEPIIYSLILSLVMLLPGSCDPLVWLHHTGETSPLFVFWSSGGDQICFDTSEVPELFYFVAVFFPRAPAVVFNLHCIK